jgi:hypothetical protein
MHGGATVAIVSKAVVVLVVGRLVGAAIGAAPYISTSCVPTLPTLPTASVRGLHCPWRFTVYGDLDGADHGNVGAV